MWETGSCYSMLMSMPGERERERVREVEKERGKMTEWEKWGIEGEGCVSAKRITCCTHTQESSRVDGLILHEQAGKIEEETHKA